MKPKSSFLTWLIGLGLGAIIVILLAPQTAWIGRQQWSSVLMARQTPISRSLQPHDALYAPFRSVAASHPEDLQVQLAYADQFATGPSMANQQGRTTVLLLDKLAPRFDDRPSYYADKLRFESLDLKLDRDVSLLTQGANSAKDRRDSSSGESAAQLKQSSGNPPSVDRAQIDEFISDAQAGRRLDPENAYFPFMESAALFAEHRDGDAIAAIEQAGAETGWNEYTTDQTYGQWRLQELAFGDKSLIFRIAADASLLCPECPILRAASRVAIVAAIKHEAAGDPHDGIRIRAAVMRCGALMRCRSTTIIGALVGMSISQTAMDRPDGAPHRDLPERVSVAQRNAFFMQSVDDYTSFLSRHGVPAEGRWARQELIAGNDTRNLHAFLDCAGYLRLWTIAGLWLGSLFLTALVTLSLLVALAAALLRRSALGAPEGPAEPGTFWGALIGLLSTMVIYARISLLGFLTYDMQTVAIMLSATVIVIACAAAIARSLRAQWRDANINGKFIDIRAAIATLGFMLIFAGVLSLTLTPVRGFLYTGNSLIGAESSNPDANAVFAHLPEFILFDLFLIAAFDAIRFWRKDPIGFLGRCARRACGLAAFLLIANCACIAITARYERQGSEMLVRMITNEYVLNTQLMGKTLPPYIPPPPMP